MRVPLALLSLSLAATLPAATTLTFQGTIANGPVQVNEPFTLTLTLSDATSLSDGPFESGMAYYGISYRDGDLSHQDLIGGISGTGISGQWSRPDLGWEAPETSLALNTTGLRLYIGSDTFEGLGFSFHGVAVDQLLLQPALMGPTWSPGGGNFSQVFAGLAGTYDLWNLEPSYIFPLAGGYDQAFILSLSTLTVVPEPSTYGLVLGGFALACVVVRRRRKTSK